jgi:hypothetical protein
MKKAPGCWNMSAMKTILSPHVVQNIVFLHALLGCDTSALYGIGRKMSLKLNAGELALVEIYKGHERDVLDYLRFKRFQQKVGSSTSLVRPKVLPPTCTSAAAAFYSLRVQLDGVR